MKKFLYIVFGIVAILVVASVSFYLLFDPNDFRDRISGEVETATGRELVIEGDLELSLFPWLAIEIGPTRLGNAPGFGSEPFASFDTARLSVRLLPLLLRREITVGVAELDGMQLNLAVDSSGRSNWEDLLQAGEAAPAQEQVDAPAGSDLQINGVSIRDATLTYTDAQLGESYSLTELNLSTGGIGAGEPVNVAVGFDFEAQPADLRGSFELSTDLVLDTAARTVGLQDIEVSLAGLDLSADVDPFAYDGDLMPVVVFETDAFSLKSLMQALGIEPLETADPDALGMVSLSGTARVTPQFIGIDDLELRIDDTDFAGEVSVARDATGTISVDLAGDSIDLTRYMAPATDATGGTEESVPVEIPSELVRALNLRGALLLDEAMLSGLAFTDIELGVTARDGVLHMHPISAQLYDGRYDGDVRIDASADTPVLSVNEKVVGVNLGSLAKEMFDQDNISGSINGTFTLSGRGTDLGAVQQSLRGNMSFELIDGAWEGTDIWYQLRRARALVRQEAAPEPTLPARTQFTSVQLSGPVRDGVFSNDDLLAELPFMQLTGNGSVDLVAAEIDYRLSARVLRSPELAGEITPEELDDLTGTVIPLRIEGALAGPSIKPDFESVIRQKVEEEVEEQVEEKVRDKVEDKLKDLLRR